MAIRQPFRPTKGSRWYRAFVAATALSRRAIGQAYPRTHDSQRIENLEWTINSAPFGFFGYGFLEDDPLCLGFATSSQRLRELEPPDIVGRIRNPDDGPLKSGSSFAPEHLSRTVWPTNQRGSLAVCDICKLVTLIIHHNFDWTDSACPSPADLVRAKWVKQNCEATEMRDVLGCLTVGGDLILELTLICCGSNNRGIETKDFKTSPTASTLIANLDDVALTNDIQQISELIVVSTLTLLDVLQEGIPDFLQRCRAAGQPGFF